MGAAAPIRLGFAEKGSRTRRLFNHRRQCVSSSGPTARWTASSNPSPLGRHYQPPVFGAMNAGHPPHWGSVEAV